MNKKQFSERIKSFDFKTLFNEFGWDRFEDKLNSIVVDQTAYTITGIAQKRGFVIVQCGADNAGKIPASTIRKKIEHEFSKRYQEHIIIFVDSAQTEQKWQYVIAEDNKPRRVREAEYRLSQDTEALFQRMKNLVFSIDDEENIALIDVLKKVNENFAKNTEKVTKKFYEEFKKYHTAFLKFITGIEDTIEDKKNLNKQWYASLMMNRLMFCYFIQKKGFLDGNLNYLSDKLQECQKKHGQDKFFSFYRQFLLVLFHDNLGKPEEKREKQTAVDFGKIPYLNGGLFDVHELEQKFTDIQINDKAFEDIFKFFDQWQWHLDTSDHGDGRHINPDVIGYIFEKYINDRAEMGAYYTKEDITNYIGQNCILPFLFDKIAQNYPQALKAGNYIWEFLKDSRDTYIYDAVKHGVPDSKDELYADLPADIAAGFDDELAEKLVSDETEVHLWQKRQCWNKKVENSDIALPTETYRELISRRERCAELRVKISGGEIVQINDFITYNLNIRQFTQDILDNIPDPDFIKKFYQALKSVTILDPTCGSGAFLFAALNILEPLYATCIRRMENFVAEAPAGHFKIFEEVLQEVNSDKHPNQEYFIFKSIILNNLYGVDIMKEAVEIAKLRLFLKLVATVEVNRRKPNMGLEPLPDIDFNIRAGNTLVGFATETELLNALSEDLLSQQRVEEFKERTALVAQAFKRFQDAQLVRQPYHAAKADYQNRLNELNEELNILLADGYGIDASNTAAYAKWKATHQPFHWFTEFYEIVVNNGGFDVIIGNPPYVQLRKINYNFQDGMYFSLAGKNLYSLVIERCLKIIHPCSEFGMIVPISVCSGEKFSYIIDRLFSKQSWISTFSNRPGKLFDGVEQRLAIFIVKNVKGNCFSTAYQHWYSEEREFLFNNLSYAKTFFEKNLPVKTGSKIAKCVLTKIFSASGKIFSLTGTDGGMWFHDAPTYWVRSLPFCPEDNMNENSSHYHEIATNSPENAKLVTMLLASTSFYISYKVLSNCRDFGVANIQTFCYPKQATILAEKSKVYEKVLLETAKDCGRQYASGYVTYKEYYPAKCKGVIDDIDTILSMYYGHTEVELDWVINYDIKYRIGED